MDNKFLISLLDLTSLNEDDTALQIETLSNKAVGSLGAVAAVCIYPKFVTLAKQQLQHTPVQVATVANFPAGSHPLNKVLAEIELALLDGVDEVDVVMPYQDYLLGNKKTTRELVKQAKDLCAQHTLKVILETGILNEDAIIYDVSCHVLDAGADFIKTSTGKVPVGATLAAAKQMLTAIKQVNPAAGFKVSGGVKTPEQAGNYIKLAEEIMGNPWCHAQHLRIGASSLLDHLYKQG